MKVLTAYVISFCCHWLGHFVSRAFVQFEPTAFMYPVYNRLMCWSIDAEDWAGIEYMWHPASARDQPGYEADEAI